MRIISGYARGLKLKCPHGYDVRPTTDRVKESMFSILGDVSGQRVVDLFAGSGALGLEVLSRGAAEVVFVEKKREPMRYLEFNLSRVEKCLPPDVQSETRIIKADVHRVPDVLSIHRHNVDLIFADPPYVKTSSFGVSATDIVKSDDFRDWAGNAILILEHPVAASLVPDGENPWRILRQRQFNNTCITFLQLKSESRVNQ